MLIPLGGHDGLLTSLAMIEGTAITPTESSFRRQSSILMSRPLLPATIAVRLWGAYAITRELARMIFFRSFRG